MAIVDSREFRGLQSIDDSYDPTKLAQAWQDLTKRRVRLLVGSSENSWLFLF